MLSHESRAPQTLGVLKPLLDQIVIAKIMKLLLREYLIKEKPTPKDRNLRQFPTSSHKEKDHESIKAKRI
ncbi:hypothetical protein CsSME_00052511 [Camellia sinensis var. sinensis]